MVIKEVELTAFDSPHAKRPKLPDGYDFARSDNETSAVDSATRGNVALTLSTTSKPRLNQLPPTNSATVHDVAAFILQQQGEMTAMKLEKLAYYSQAWSLVWDEEPLFSEDIEAWANGPVIPALYARHKGLFKLREWNGDPARLTDTQRETILKVLEFYGPMPSQVLSDLTHQEDPWLRARVGLGIGERGSKVISHADLAEYYSSL